jgi:glycosyltransferase involved in cell wall biosynthesis
MRILMASDLFYPFLLGGGERRMYEIAHRLAKKHEIHVVTRRFKGLPNYEQHEGVHIHRVFVPSAGIKLESPVDGSAFMAGALLKGLNLGDFDLYAPQQFFPIFPLWLTAKVKRKPLVATIHDVYRETWLQKYGLRGCLMAAFEKVMLELQYTRIITVSSSSKQKLIESGVPEHRIEIIPNGVDVEKYDEVKAEKSDRPRVIYVGRLIGYKHVDDLLLAFSRLDLDAELYIVGEGPERKNLEALVRELRIDHKVAFTGFVDERKKIELLKSSHVLVLPSTTEGFGIAVLEAMAARVPAIAADIPALHELVKDGENGLFFKPRAIDDLKTKLKLLLKDGALRDKFSKCGYDLVGEEFTWGRVTEKNEEIYKSLC